jgi:hypothetical protein
MVDRPPGPGHGGGFIVDLTREGLDIVEKAIVELAGESSSVLAMAHLTDPTRNKLRATSSSCGH